MTEIDADMAARFLAALTGDTLHTFQTFDDAGKGRRGLTDVLHGTFAQHADKLARYNAKGAGVFVMVNRGDGMGRCAANVIGCRALFVDLDGSPIEPVLAATIPPRIVVESSPGKWHAYWPIADLPPAYFSPAQRTLAALFAGDPKVHDKPRVMRLPGFLHRKGEPVQTRLEHCQSAPLTWGEMAAAYGLADRLTLPDAIQEGARNDTLFKLARSASRKGVPEAQQLAKVQAVNAKRCLPPLPEAEVRGIVASAYREPERGILPLPLALLEAEAYKAADDAVRTLLLLAYRRADGFNAGCVTLPHSELGEWFPRKNTFLEVRARAVESGLLTIARPATKRMPRKGRGPRPNFYQLAIGPFCATYSQAPIGPFSATPEVFQVVASDEPLRSAAQPKAKTAASGQ